MVNLLVLILLLSIARSQETLSDCFHNQKFQIVNTTAFLFQTGGYAYNIPWTKTQGNITKYSFTLVGFFNTAAFNEQAFNASLINVNPTDGTFIFDPQSSSSIVNIEFSIILIGTCSGYIQLQYIEYEPVQFNVAAASRVQNISVYNVTVPSPFTADLTNYKTYVFISAFYLTQISTIDFALRIKLKPITALSTTHQVNVISMASLRNRYSRIWFTYLLINLPLFQEEISYYFSNYDFVALGWTGNEAIVPNFGIPDFFNPNLTNKCVISLYYIWTYKGSRETQINFANLGTNFLTSITTIKQQYINEASYQIFCLQQCSLGSSIDKNFSTSICIKCNQTVPYCQKCYYGDLNATFNIFTFNETNSTVNKTLYCTKCQTNYYLYSFDNKCYSTCPIGTYASNSTGKCLYCNSACTSCVDNLNCQSCKIGWAVEGGCTIIDGCTNAISPIICSKCSDKINFVLVGGSCTCAVGYYLVSHLCVNVFGCIGAVVSGNSTACILCNSYIGLVMDSGLCRCKDDYYFGTTKCRQICGDGKLYQHQCDDGNTANGDGCSSSCIVQADYQCSGGSKIRPSKCIYFKTNINLTVVNIQKADLYNKGFFTVRISPQTGNIALLDLSSAVQFQCNQSISIQDISYNNSQMVITVQYFQDLEGFLADIILTLDSKYYVQPSARVTFNMTSNGNKLIRTRDLAFIKSMSIVLSIIALIVFALSLTVHKMIGVELLISFQIVYLVHLVNNQFTQQYALLKYLSYTSWNFQGIPKGSTNVYTVSSNEHFDIDSQIFALKMMISLFFAIIAVLITVLAVKTVKRSRKSALPKKPFIKTILLLYNQILFPITIGFVFVYLVIINTIKVEKGIDIPYLIKYLQPALMILLSLLFSFEWKALLISNINDPYVGVDKCQKAYIAFFITIFFIITMTISFSCYHPQFNPTIPVLGLELFLLLWLIGYRPYVGSVHNVGVVINLLPSIAFLSWNVLRQKLKLSQNRQLQFLLIFALLIIFSLSIFISFIRIIYQICLMRQERKAAMAYKLQRQISQQRKMEELQLIEKKRMETNKAGLEAPQLQLINRVLDAPQLQLINRAQDAPQLQLFKRPQYDPQFQPFKRSQDFYHYQRFNPLSVNLLSDNLNGNNSILSLSKIKNRLGQSDYEAGRKRLHHLV